MPLDEAWSWKKFFLGFVSGKNYAKAIVLGVCLTVIAVISFSVITVVTSRFKKTPPPAQTVGENKGIIATQNEDKSGNTYSLFNLFNWK